MSFRIAKTKDVEMRSLFNEFKAVYPDGDIAIDEKANEFLVELETTPETIDAITANVQSIIDVHDKTVGENEIKIARIKRLRNQILIATDGIRQREDREQYLIDQGESVTKSLSSEELLDCEIFRQSIMLFDETVDLNDIAWPTPPTCLNKYLNKFEPYSSLI
jgi:hypothetical protein